jgi:hypothetical protein
VPSVELNGQLIYFAHCPKAGGTSVERFMVDRWGASVRLLGWGWDRRWAGRGEQAGEVPSSPQHYVWEDARRALPRAPDAVFTVVRDPVARMVSEYRYQREGRLTGPFGRPVRRLGFSAWLRLMFALADRNPYTHDNHFRPQAAFLPAEGARVFRLEDGLQPVLTWLAERAGEPPPKEVPHDLGAGSGPRVAPTPEDRALIAQRFDQDYRRFGYVCGDAARDPGTGRAMAPRAVAALLDPLYRKGLV